MCDCGLHHFGEHLIDCKSRTAYEYVIAFDHENALLPREQTS